MPGLGKVISQITLPPTQFFSSLLDSIPLADRVRRSRLVYVALAAATVLLGLASRRYADSFPDVVRLYVGDAMWAATVYFAAAAVWPRASIPRIAIGSLLFSLVIETSQLYHAPWIDAVRATRPGGLVLGFGFLWSDLICYVVGIGVAALADAWSLRHARGKDIVS
jgi:hypothetical protein